MCITSIVKGGVQITVYELQTFLYFLLNLECSVQYEINLCC
jgi:hypothetical protein